MEYTRCWKEEVEEENDIKLICGRIYLKEKKMNMEILIQLRISSFRIENKCGFFYISLLIIEGKYKILLFLIKRIGVEFVEREN